jgi:hypothetical protein
MLHFLRCVGLLKECNRGGCTRDLEARGHDLPLMHSFIHSIFHSLISSGENYGHLLVQTKYGSYSIIFFLVFFVLKIKCPLSQSFNRRVEKSLSLWLIGIIYYICSFLCKQQEATILIVTLHYFRCSVQTTYLQLMNSTYISQVGFWYVCYYCCYCCYHCYFNYFNAYTDNGCAPTGLLDF